MIGDEFYPDENSTILSNHKSIYDIFAIFYICGHFDRIIGFCLKKSVSYVPGCGKWCTHLNFPTLSRDVSDIAKLESYKKEFPIVIYPEGTRFTQENHNKSYKFAKQNDFPISKYAALPKYAGSFALSKGIVYHFTLIYLNKQQQIMRGEINEAPSRIYIHVKKHIDYPTTPNEYKRWLQEQFVNIDEIYDNFSLTTNALEMVPSFKRRDYYWNIFYVYCSSSFISRSMALFKRVISLTKLDISVFTFSISCSSLSNRDFSLTSSLQTTFFFLSSGGTMTSFRRECFVMTGNSLTSSLTTPLSMF
jgi:1-acyl-sn-glycerol-3-phosphate acyltransferase